MHTYFYATGDFDRSAQHREDHGWLKARLIRSQQPASIPSGGCAIWCMSDDRYRKSALSRSCRARPISLPRAETVILLGVEGERRPFCRSISPCSMKMPRSELGDFQELRGIGPLLPQRDGALLAYARGLAYWHQRHRYCGVCGAPTEVKAAGHQRQCIDRDCATVQFPRTDPAVIMRVTCGNQDSDGAPGACGRRACIRCWPVSSSRAKSLEDAVAREVFEEVGLRVRDVRYFGSQPWPFPASLMLGFTAEADSEAFDLRDGEIESARWMTRMDLLNSPEDDDLPPAARRFDLTPPDRGLGEAVNRPG